MAKRRRCKDKLPHPEHEWGAQTDGHSNGQTLAIATIYLAAGRVRKVAQTYWCPGRKEEVERGNA